MSYNDIICYYFVLIILGRDRSECLGYGICLTVFSVSCSFTATILATWEMTKHSSPLLLAGMITGILLSVLSFIGLIAAIITCFRCGLSKTYIVFSITTILGIIPVISGTLMFLDAGLNSPNVGVVCAAGAIFIVTSFLHCLSCGLLAYSRCHVDID